MSGEWIFFLILAAIVSVLCPACLKSVVAIVSEDQPANVKAAA